MNRQPSVVSSIFNEREKALSALAMTKGARDMLSTPPAITRSASPDLMARAAEAMASILEPQSRLTVVPGTRSEERRVGKESRYQWSPCHEKKKERDNYADEQVMIEFSAELKC